MQPRRKLSSVKLQPKTNRHHAELLQRGLALQGRGKGKAKKVAEPKAAFGAEVANLSPAALSRKLKHMEAQMHEHAKNLEFEEAAALRDQLAEIKQLAFVS